jgi:tripartite-type tricarboxylate transporter receptor subunit TctC
MGLSVKCLGTAALASLLGLAAVALPAPAAAQVLPGRPITVVVAFPPGASADTTMRLITQKITEDTGQQFVIDNRSGAAGFLAANAVKQAVPDGHTLLQVVVGTLVTNQVTSADPGYDLRRDFEPITQLWNLPLALVVPETSKAHTVAELISLAKTKAGGMNYASTAVNSAGHLLGGMLASAGHVNMVHVPYRGAAPAVTDLVAGRIDFYFVSYASVSSFVESGKLRVLAVAAPRRLTALPDVPTMAEAGFPQVALGVQWGIAAPAKAPRPVIEALHKAFVSAANDPIIVKRMGDQGIEMTTSSPEEFGAIIASEFDKIDHILRAAGVKSQ